MIENFSKKYRTTLLLISAFTFVFFSRSFFDKTKLGFSNIVVLSLSVLNIIGYFLSKPLPPKNEQETRETPETKQS
jgi:hypothetical protein